MDEKPRTDRRTRRRALGAACAALIAGGTLLAVPAHASTSDGTCAPVVATGTGSSAIRLPVGGALTLGVMRCATTSGDPIEPAPAPTVAVEPTPAVPLPADPPTASPGGSSTTIVAAPAPAVTAVPPPTALADIALERSTTTVYPVKDGYRDAVRFSVRTIDGTGAAVTVRGTATLSRAGRTVRTWRLDGKRSLLTWDGRVHGAVRAGVYRLAVTAWSGDGTRRTATTTVRVVADHLRRDAVVVRSTIGASDITAAMPKRLIAAFAKGAVSCRVRTVASVKGPAKLVFSNDGVSRSLRLRNGTHTTPALVVPKGFEQVTIHHRWKRGDVHLKSVQAIWTYYSLVR